MSERVLILRTCAADMSSHNGFRWPEAGPVECADWNPAHVCGGGLHGLLWGEGSAGNLSSDADAKCRTGPTRRASSCAWRRAMRRRTRLDAEAQRRGAGHLKLCSLRLCVSASKSERRWLRGAQRGRCAFARRIYRGGGGHRRFAKAHGQHPFRDWLSLWDWHCPAISEGDIVVLGRCSRRFFSRHGKNLLSLAAYRAVRAGAIGQRSWAETASPRRLIGLPTPVTAPLVSPSKHTLRHFQNYNGRRWR
jgi:hypothetical protein